MNKTDLDLSYITSRVAVMSFPAEGVESAIKNHIDDVRNYLEAKHRGSYAIYNLSQRTYRPTKFENRVRSSTLKQMCLCMLDKSFLCLTVLACVR